MKRLSVILCSGFFFPVSCTLGTTLSLPVIQHFDVRNVTKGDEPHFDSFVLVNSQGMIKKVRLENVENYKAEHPQASFLIKEDAGIIDVNAYTTISYEIVEKSEDRQIIDATLSDDDGHVSVRYEIEGSDIRPLSSEGNFRSYAFLALRNGIILALILYLLGRVLRKAYS